jgi:hypothetical protein
LIDCNTSAWTRTEFRISQAYLKLCALPEGNPQALVSLASIGSHEIRMLRDPATDLDSAPLFWLELFDDSTKTSVDSFCCHRLEDAVPVVRDFFTQIDNSNKTGERPADEGLSNPSGNLAPAGRRVCVDQRSDNRPAQARAVREACRTPERAGGRG